MDECPDEVHTRLAEIVRRASSNLRLITIDIETDITASDETVVIRLERASDAIIEGIAQGIGAGLSDANVGFVRRLADGHPRMAVYAAEALAENRDPIVSVEQLVDRVVWGRAAKNEEAARSLECAAMFGALGVDGNARADLDLVATNLAGLRAERMREHLLDFEPRGVVVRRGDYVQVEPLPLAARLGRRQLDLLGPDRLYRFLADAPEPMRLRFLDRLRWLDWSENARAIAASLLAEDELGNLDALNTDFGARCFYRLVHVYPDRATATLDRVFASLPDEQLASVGPGRRYLVGALAMLVFRRESFASAARLLLRFAGSETEPNIGNNASGQFKNLFQLWLSGTEVEPGPRIEVLDKGLASPDERVRSVCVDALGKMLDRHHFTRMGGADAIGSAPPLRDWRPKLYSEAFDLHRAGLTRLAYVACSGDPLAARARGHLATHVRALLCPNLFDEVVAMLDRVTARIGFWPEALKGVGDWLFFDRKEAPAEFAARVRALYDRLLPEDPVDLAVFYASDWPGSLRDPDANNDRGASGVDIGYAARQATEIAERIAADPALADRLLVRLMSPDLHATATPAQCLGRLADDPIATFARAVEIVERGEGAIDLDTLGGLVQGASDRDPEIARECIRSAFRSPQLKAVAINLFRYGRIDGLDLDFVVGLLRAGDLRPSECIALARGASLEGVLEDVVARFVDEVAARGAEGLWSALEIVAMLLHGPEGFPDALAARVRSYLVDPRLLASIPGGSLDGFFVQTSYERLVEHGLVDDALASKMARQVLRFPLADTHIHSALENGAKAVLDDLLDRFPNLVWREVEALFPLDPTRRWMLEHFLEPSRPALDDHHHGSSGPLSKVLADLYLAWAREAPTERVPFVLSWMPIVVRADDGRLSWHPLADRVAAEFGDDRRNLEAIFWRLRPRSWAGSLVPYLAPCLPLVKEWFSHPKTAVRLWARETHQWLTEEIDRQRKRDEEQDLIT